MTEFLAGGPTPQSQLADPSGLQDGTVQVVDGRYFRTERSDGKMRWREVKPISSEKFEALRIRALYLMGIGAAISLTSLLLFVILGDTFAVAYAFALMGGLGVGIYGLFATRRFIAVDESEGPANADR